MTDKNRVTSRRGKCDTETGTIGEGAPAEARTPTRQPGIILTRLVASPAWLVTNLVLGWCAIFPLVSAVLMWDYVKAKLGGNAPDPFDSGEHGIAVAMFVIGIAFLVAEFGLANWMLRRWLRSWPAVHFWLGALIIQLVPFVWFMTATDRTVGILVGR